MKRIDVSYLLKQKIKGHSYKSEEKQIDLNEESNTNISNKKHEFVLTKNIL
jgi:hypothetical protein